MTRIVLFGLLLVGAACEGHAHREVAREGPESRSKSPIRPSPGGSGPPSKSVRRTFQMLVPERPGMVHRPQTFGPRSGQWMSRRGMAETESRRRMRAGSFGYSGISCLRGRWRKPLRWSPTHGGGVGGRENSERRIRTSPRPGLWDSNGIGQSPDQSRFVRSSERLARGAAVPGEDSYAMPRWRRRLGWRSAGRWVLDL